MVSWALSPPPCPMVVAAASWLLMFEFLLDAVHRDLCDSLGDVTHLLTIALRWQFLSLYFTATC